MASIRLFHNYLRIPYLVLSLIEALLFYFSVFCAVYIRFYWRDYNDEDVGAYFGNVHALATIFTVVMIVAMIAMGQYQSSQYNKEHNFSNNLLRTAVALLLGSFALITLYYFFPKLYMGRGVSAIAVNLSLFFSVVVREIFVRTVDSRVLKRRVLVFGSGRRAAMLASEMGGMDVGLSYEIVAYIPVEGEDTVVRSNRVVALNSRLLDFALTHEIEEIVVALDDRRNRLPMEELISCRLAGILVITPATFLEREQDKISLDMLSPDWVIFSSGFHHNTMHLFLQRSFDVVSSLIILLLMLPLMSVTAFLIAAESNFKAPVFYRQKRVGLGGRTFELLKFRSMRVDAEANGQAVWAKQNDNRITRVGHFIRQTRIDELPQIINILKGDMRLVGPRPERPEFVEGLSKRIPYYSQRHTVKPGLAGWAQLKYPYGATEKDAREKLRFDMYYVKNHNIVMDIFILIQTVEIVVFGKGAR